MREERKVLRKYCLSFCLLLSSLLLTLSSICCLLACTPSAVSAEVTENRSVLHRVRHVSVAGSTRVIFILSRAVRQQIFMTPADPNKGLPPRLVMDFPQTQIGPYVPPELSIHDGLLKHVRTSRFSASTTRVVFESEQSGNYQTSVLHDPFRIIIDVTAGVRQKAPVTAVKEKEPAPTFTIMLDPGHGGKDPGAIGEGNVSEKDVVLAISKRVGRKLAARLLVKVLYTRFTDVFVPLEERIVKANAAGADVFVSIHANASTNPDLQGVETYYLNNTNDRATIRLAALENGIRPGGKSINDSLSFVLSDLIQNGKEEESVALANQLQESIVSRARDRYPSVHNLGVKKGPFYVLVGAHMPCVLVETAFLTHRVEGKYLARAEYQEALAEGLFLGLSRFLRTGRAEKSL